MASNIRIVPGSDLLRVGEVRTLQATDPITGNPIVAYWWINPRLTGVGDEDNDHLIPHPSSAITFVDDQGQEYADVSSTPVSMVKVKGTSLNYTETGDFGSVQAARILWSNTAVWHDQWDLISFNTYEVDHQSSFKIADIEYDLKGVEVSGVRVCWSIPGVRLRLRSNFRSNVLSSVQFEWSATAGNFFRGYNRAEPIVAPAQADGSTMDEIYWELTDFTVSDATVTFRAKISGDLIDEKQFRFKSRAISEGTEGDDARMLQRLLWCLGTSVGDTPGVQGTPISVDGSFGEKSVRGLKRFQSGNELTASGTLDHDTWSTLMTHYRDYSAAYSAYPTSPVIDTSHAEFPSWIAAASTVLSATLTDAILATIQSGLKRDAILLAWLKREASLKHWGYKDRYFRVSTGSADVDGEDAAKKVSIGFSQIQSRYRYGVSSLMPGLSLLNLYNPADAVRGFAVFSDDTSLGGGFRKAFVLGSFKKTKSYPDNFFPRLGSSYTDDNKDLLCKAIMSYNGGSSAYYSNVWPEVLRAAPVINPTTSTGAPQRAIFYTIDVQINAGVNLKTWKWTDTNNGTPFSFTYSEVEWHTGTSWQTKRDQSIPH